MSYNSIRNFVMKNGKIFDFVHYIYTPIRKTKEHFIRREMADKIINKHCKVNSSEVKIYYFGIPEHNNMGDIAQTYCTLKWIKENYPERIVISTKTRVTFDNTFLDFIETNHNKQDIIIFQSGYCTRHKNPDHLMHLNIAKRFPEYKMIILPQTVKLENKRDIEKTKRIFNNATNLTFIARDNVSLEYAKQFVTQDKLDCFPDIVTSLIGRMNVDKERKGILLCLRNDAEKYYRDEELLCLKTKLEEYNICVEISDTNSDKTTEQVFENLQGEVEGIVAKFASYECVITDRYHGTIFSLIANTPVIVIKTKDHKVTSAVEWFNGIYSPQAIQVAKTLNQAYELAIEIMDHKQHTINPDVLYKKYYTTKLKSIFEKA